MVRELGGGRLMAGEEANESAFKATDLGSYRVLHLAVHALVDYERPERSARFTRRVR